MSLHLCNQKQHTVDGAWQCVLMHYMRNRSYDVRDERGVIKIQLIGVWIIICAYVATFEYLCAISVCGIIYLLTLVLLHYIHACVCVYGVSNGIRK